MKSILQDKEECWFCGTTQNLATHHIYFGIKNRKISDENGFIVRLCHRCHNLGGNGKCVHQCKEMDLELKRVCQKKYESMGHSREEFINLIGKSYILD